MGIQDRQWYRDAHRQAQQRYARSRPRLLLSLTVWLAVIGAVTVAATIWHFETANDCRLKGWIVVCPMYDRR